MADINVSIGAEGAEFRSQIELVKAALRDLNGRIRDLSDEMVQGGKAADTGLRAQLANLSGQSESLGSALRSMSAELKVARTTMDESADSAGRVARSYVGLGTAAAEVQSSINAMSRALAAQEAEMVSADAAIASLVASQRGLAAAQLGMAELAAGQGPMAAAAMQRAAPEIRGLAGLEDVAAGTAALATYNAGLATQKESETSIADAIARHEAQQKALTLAVTSGNAAQLAKIRASNLAAAAVKGEGAATVDIIGAITGAGRASAFTAEQIAEMEKGWPRASAAIRQFGEVGKASMGNLGVATREFTSIFDEWVRGAGTGRIVGSVSVLARAFGLVDAAIAGLATPMGAVVAASAVFAGGLGYLAYAASSANTQLNEMVATLSATGQALTTSKDQLAGWVGELTHIEGLGRSVSSQVVSAFDNLPPALQASREAIQQLVTRFAQAQGLDVAKTAHQWAEAFRTAHGAVELLEKATGALDPAIKEHIEIQIRAGNESNAFAEVLDILQARLRDISGWQSQKNAAEEYIRLMRQAGEGAGAFLPTPPPGLRPGFRTEAIPAGGGQNVQQALQFFAGKGLTQAQAAGIVGTLQQESGALNPAEVTGNHIGIAQWSPERAKALGITTSSSLQDQLEAVWKEFQSSEAPAFARIKAAQTPEAAAAGMQSFERPDVDYGAKAQAAARSIYASTARTDPATADAERVTDKLLTTKQKIAELDAQIATLSAIPNRNADQQAALDTAILDRMKQRTPLEREADAAQLQVLEKAKLLATTDEQRLTIENQIADIKRREAGGTDSAQATYQLETTRAQIGYDTAQLNVQKQQLEALKAQTEDRAKRRDLDIQILAINEQLSSKAGGSPGVAAATRAAGEANVNRQYAAGTRQLAEQDAAAQQQLNDIKLQTLKFELGQEVDQHKIKNAQALATERQFTSDLESENIRRLSDLRSTLTDDTREWMKVNLEVEQAQLKLREDLARIDKEMADDAKKSAKETAEPFVQAFDSIGSSSEKAFNSVVLGESRGKDASLQFARSIEGDLLKSVEHFASIWAAKGLGSLIGITPDKGAGLGDVLGQGVSKLLNLNGSSGDAVQAAANVATLANTTSTTANTAALVTNTAAQGASGAGGAAGAAGGFFGGISKLFGFERGGVVPSAAGGFLVPGGALGGGTLAILHPQEMVLPANISEGVQRAVGGAGEGNTTNANFTYAPTLNGGGAFATRAQAETFFRQHGEVMMGQLRNAARNGWRP